MREKKCLVCRAKLFEEPLLKFDNLPSSAQNIPSKDMLQEEHGISLGLYQCTGCGLVQFDCKPVCYYKDVIRSGGFSTTMVELRRLQYMKLIDKYQLINKKFIEIGCGQGEFLSILEEFPVRAFGIENNKSLVNKALDRGLNVTRGFVESGDTVIENGPFDVFLSFNFLEHQPDPNAMLQGIYNNLTEGGIGLITVPSLEYILANNGYYEFIRDHLVYYTFDTLRFVLEKNGFVVLEQEMINRDTLSVIVCKKSRLDVREIAESYNIICEQINDYIDKVYERGGKVAIWGASHQGFTIAATAHLEEKVECIIDSAPFKQGLYAPASHIPIISPEDAKKKELDAIIIMAPGYTNEIASTIIKEFNNDIEIMVMITKELQHYEECGCQKE